ncbi:thiamine diphosphokinase [Candidatus Bipolaricaulota bacterium]|nr:thiamine diphosphokinase [Candidatus Bipolaricaulota bacterium]
MAERAILILANGDWGGNDILPRLHRLVQNADHVVATDGALDHAIECDIEVHTLIGDLDSLSDPTKLEERFPNMEILRYPEDKDWTDLELAINWALEQAPASIAVFGAIGGRIDHTMANLALLEKGLHSGIPIQLISGNESVRLIQGSLPLENAGAGDRISLLPISLFATVSTQGLKYSLTSQKLFRGQGRGISNVVVSTPARVDVESGVVAVVHAVGPDEAG